MTVKNAFRGTLVVVALAVVVLGFSSGAAAHGGDDGLHHHDGWMGTHGGLDAFGILWMLVWVLVLVGVPAVVYAYVTHRRDDGRSGGDEALSLLRSRYARGEIDEAEFEQRRERLARPDQME